MDYRKELKKKLSENYDRFMKQWMSSDPAALIAAAEEIAAAKFIRDSLADSISNGDAAFLLALDDPLEAMSGKWVEENGAECVHDDELLHCVMSLAEENGFDLSVLEEGGEIRLC